MPSVFDNGGLIGKTNTPNTSIASGLWSLGAQFDAKAASNWPFLEFITDGLSLHLDAGDTSSYPGSGTTWTDLSGNGRNGTLTNGPTFNSDNGGSIVFDGTDDYVQVSGSIVTSTATFIVWIRRNGSQGSYDGILFSRGTSVSGLGFSTSNQISYTWNNSSSTWGWSTGLTVPDLAWCMCAVTVGASSATAYLCQSTGITSAINNVSHTTTTIDDIKVAQDDTGGRFFNGRVAIAAIYNRALTSDEITTNFQLTRSRFGV